MRRVAVGSNCAVVHPDDLSASERVAVLGEQWDELIGGAGGLRTSFGRLNLGLVQCVRAGRLVSKDEALSSVWRGVRVEENTLQSHLAAPRTVVGTDVALDWGRYRFVHDVVRPPSADFGEDAASLENRLLSDAAAVDRTWALGNE